jgi:hypothetical protein
MAPYVGVVEDHLFWLGPTILQLQPDQRTWKAHPNDKAVSVFKPVDCLLTLGIHVYGKSKSEAMVSAPEHTVIVHKNEVLAVLGGCWIESLVQAPMVIWLGLASNVVGHRVLDPAFRQDLADFMVAMVYPI